MPHTEEQETLFAAAERGPCGRRRDCAATGSVLPLSAQRSAHRSAAGRRRGGRGRRATGQGRTSGDRQDLDRRAVFAQSRAATDAPIARAGAVDLCRGVHLAGRSGALANARGSAPGGSFALPQPDAMAGEDTFYAYCRLQSGVSQRVRFIVTVVQRREDLAERRPDLRKRRRGRQAPLCQYRAVASASRAATTC